MSCKITYKGKSYTEEQLMEVLSRDSSIVDKYRPQEQRVIGSEQKETMQVFEAKVAALKESMDVEVILDENIPSSRVLAASDPRTKRAGKPVILINPNAIFSTTAIHEFGHIFIDSFPDGLNNRRLQEALKELEGTELYGQVKDAYPDLSEEMFQKELLTTAIGIKGAEIWDNREKAGAFEAFKNWFFDFLKRTFGLSQSQVESLAKDLIDGRVQADLNAQLSDYIQEERLVDVVGEENMEKYETNLEILYQETLARVSNLYNLYQPKSKAERTRENQKKREGKRTAFESVSEMQEALERYSEAEQARGIFHFVKWAGKETKKLGWRIEKAKEDGNLDPDLIVRLREFSGAFDILDDIKKFVTNARNRNEITEVQYNRYMKQIGAITEERDKYEKDLLEVSKEHYARIMAANDVETQEKYKQLFAKKWEEIQPDIPKNQYVQEQYNKFKDDIFEESRQKFRARAEKSTGDMSSAVAILATEKNMKSDEIQVASKLVDGKELAVQRFASEEATLFDKWVKEYADEVAQNANQEKKYKKMIDQTPSGNRYFAGEYLAEFYEEKLNQQMQSEDREYYESAFEGYKIFKKGKGFAYSLDGGKNKKNIILKGATNVNVGKLKTTYEIAGNKYEIDTAHAIARSEYQEWLKQNTRRVKTEDGWRTLPSDGRGVSRDWRNHEWANLTADERKHLDFLKSKIKEADDLTNGTESLIKYSASQEFMKLPSVRKTSLSRLAEGKLIDGIKDAYENATQVQEDEFDTVDELNVKTRDTIKAFADVSNKEKLRVPIPFRNKIEPDKQSLDLHTITLMNLVQAKNYQQKKQVESLLLVMTDVMNNRDVPQTQGIQRLKKIHAYSKDGEERDLHKPKNEVPNDVKKMMSVIKNRIYNIKSEPAGKIAGKDVNKLTSTWLKYSGMVSLVGNIPNSIVNIQVGSFNNLMEAIGGEQFGLADYKYAKVQYWKDIKNVLDDWGSNVDTSRTNLFMNILNVIGDKQYLDNNFEENNRAKALLKQNSLRPLAKAGEHMMQAKLMYAVMRSVRVTNAKGQYLDVNGKVVSTKKEAASINEVISFEKASDGAIVMKMPDWAEGNTFSGTADHSTQLLELRNLIKKKVVDLHGNYDSDIQSEAQRHFWGKLAFFLRKWIEPGFYRRWRGLPKALRKHEDLTEADKYFSHDLKKYQEGYYVTAVRFLARTLPAAIKEVGFWHAASHSLKDMAPHEKANMRKIVTELAVLSLTMLAYMALGGDDDDENLWVRYLLRRQFSEMSFFMLPGEAYKIASTPTASMGMLKRFIQLSGQAMSPFEEYQQGKNKGELKLKVKALKMVPLFSQTEKDLEESLRFLTNMN